MRLKNITLKGYKTFASETKFEFGSGITAVIGPNGSGKSNVADAIRWSLGEQAFSLMRSKRTDDMIFAGSPKRARASMAEVRMIFDNSDGFFPIEYSEIEIGRRAYRDGTNEYILNGSRVRLREVSDLLGSSGLAERNYTVIGQGTVDSALSAKPEERRALFEEAAGIISYRDRREDALRKLEETKLNLQRAQDILAEINPRLGQLERQAAKVKQYELLTAELQTHLKVWFGFHYQNTRSAIAKSAETRDKEIKTAGELREQVNGFEASVNAVREEQNVLRLSLAGVLPQREQARQKHDNANRDLAVMRERTGSFEAQQQALQRDIETRTALLDELAIRTAHTAATVLVAQDAQAQKQRELDEAQAQATVRQTARAELERQRSQAQQTLLQTSSAVATTRNQISGQHQRKEQLQKRIEQLTQRNTQLTEQRETALHKCAELEQQIERDNARLQELETQHHAATQKLESARMSLGNAQSSLAAAEAEENLTSRMSLFAEMRAQQGTNDLVDAAQHLAGYRGTLGSHLKVLEDDQKAVAAALGEWMNAVLFETQDHALASRTWLATQHTGSLVALPLDGLRAVAPPFVLDGSAAQVLRANNATLLTACVSTNDDLKPVLALLAGRTFVCGSLDGARTVANAIAHATCVTRAGETVFANGAVKLLAGLREGESNTAATVHPYDNNDADAFAIANAGVEKIALLTPEEASAKRASWAAQRDAAAHEVETAHRDLDSATTQRDGYIRESNQRRNERNNAEQSVARYEDSLAEFAGEIEAIEQEINAVNAQASTLLQEATARDAEQSNQSVAVSAIDQALQAHMAGGWMEALNAAHAAIATANEAVRSAEAVKRERLSAYADAVKQKTDSEARLVGLTQSQANATNQLQLLLDVQTQSDAAMREIDAKLLPIQMEIGAIEQRVLAADTQRREAECVLRECESRLNAAELELGRHQNELENLREKAVDAFTDDRQQLAEEVSGLVGEQMTFEVRDRAFELLESLEPVAELPESTNENVQRLRNSVKRLGAINYEAQTEFDALSERSKFMTEQVADLEHAMTTLLQVIAELNDVMKTTFRQTFDAIAMHFQTTFKILFGGGQAKLNLVNPDNIDETGIEIVAQPPGKRPATLALLSGGERSLTATALLFAILRVKPTPFCVLDEVDAALDESNVGRMRNMIETLADSTQFIIITHNRGTVESANTIYGITMGADGASQILSLRLDDVTDETIGQAPSNNDVAKVRSGAGWVPPQN